MTYTFRLALGRKVGKSLSNRTAWKWPVPR
jgi:hypothetical protein